MTEAIENPNFPFEPKDGTKTAKIPQFKWKPENLDPKIAELMEISNRYYNKPVGFKDPELDYFRSLDINTLEKWDTQIDHVLRFYLYLKETFSFAKAAYITASYYQYKNDVWKESERLKQMGQKQMWIPYDLCVKRGVRGIHAEWYWVERERLGKQGKYVRHREYLRQTKKGYYSSNCFRKATADCKDQLLKVEGRLFPLRVQTTTMVAVVKDLVKYNRLSTKVFPRPKT